MLVNAGLPAPKFGTATSFDEAREIASAIGYPVLVRPSHVLGGRGMEIVYDEKTLHGYITAPPSFRQSITSVLVDRFLEDVIEIDVDALCDGTEVYIGGIMEHIEEAGIHRGLGLRAAAGHPGRSDIDAVRRATEAIAHGVGVVGLLNVQYALRTTCSTCWRPTHEPVAPSRSSPRPPRSRWPGLRPVMLGASISQLREEGLLARHGDGSNRIRTPHRGQGGGVAVPPLPPHGRLGDRFATRAGDEIHRRGDGHRPRFRQRSPKSQTAAYGSLPTRDGLRLGGQPRQAVAGVSGQAPGRPRVPGFWPPTAPQRCCAATVFPCSIAQTLRGPGEGRPALTALDAINAGEVDMVINTP